MARIEDYPGNSFKSKNEREEKQQEEKKIEKVVSGTVKTRERKGFRRFIDNFLNSDIETVREYIITEVILPSLKNTVSDVVSNGIDMLLFEESRGRSNRNGRNHRNSNSNSRTSYNAYYNSNSRNSSSSHYSGYGNRYTINDIILDSRGEAEDVLDNLRNIIDEYDSASVADFYDLVGVHTSYTDNGYGWYNINSAAIVRTPDGFLLKLPKPVPLDD